MKYEEQDTIFGALKMHSSRLKGLIIIRTGWTAAGSNVLKYQTVLPLDIPISPNKPEQNSQIAAGTGTAETVPLNEA
jgi:hypothetical protein